VSDPRSVGIPGAARPAALACDVVTLAPGAFVGPLHGGVLSRAIRAGRLSVRLHDLRRWGVGPHRQVDDTPYGGGGGMVLRPEPMVEAVEWVRRRYPADPETLVLLSPQGQPLSHALARELAGRPRLILLCGRYEGMDERVRRLLPHREVSLGDFVLSGGELPALALIEAVARHVPGVLGQPEAAQADSFAEGLLESPYYTRPAVFRGERVPEVLLSGDHAAIARWRVEAAWEVTRAKRPDLLEGAPGRTCRPDVKG